MKFIVRVRLFLYSVVFYVWWRCSFATAFHLMGLKTYTQDHVRLIIELYEMHDRSFNYIARSKSYVKRTKIDAEPPNWPYGVDRTNENNLYMIKPDEKLNTAINNEFVHMHQQADYGTSITDLLTTLFVQIVALNYSVEFGRGHIYFKKEGNKKNSLSCLKMAYYLAWFGSESRALIKSTSNILRNKYRAANEDLMKMDIALEKLQNKIKKSKVKVFDENFFAEDGFQDNMNEITTYFREMLLDENTDYSLEFDELQENIKLWTMASNFMKIMYNSYGTLFYNTDSNKKDLFRSNVVSTLREIELFKANLRFIKSSWQNIEYGFTMNYFLVVRRWRIDGQLKFFERLYPLILQPNFSMKSASFSDESSSEPQFVSILGTTEFEADDIRAEMEILKRYFIGYDYAIKRQVWSHFKNKDSWFSFSSDTLLKQKMENELKYIHWQSDEATNLTELLSILFVQYQAAVYAIRYAHGSVYYENRSDGSKSILCSSVAAYLGWYATESTSVIKAIKRILRVKFPDNSFDFDSFAQSMNRISLVVDEAINDEYSSAEDDISFDLSKFEDDEFKIDVQVANSFFRNLILWEKNHSEQNVVDVKGCKILWDEVNTIYKMLTTSPMDKFKNVYTDVKDMYISTAAAIIQIAELSLVEDMIFNKEKDFKNGFEDETFQVDSVNYDSVEELLRFKKILIGI